MYTRRRGIWKTAVLGHRYVGVIFLLTFVVPFGILAGLSYFPLPRWGAKELADLDSFQQKRLEIYLQAQGLLITMATLVISGVAVGFGLFRENAPEQTDRKRVTQYWWLLALCMFAAGVSILGGYASYLSLMWMLSRRIFDLSNPFVQLPKSLQFTTFLLSFFFLCWFAYEAYRAQRGNQA